MHNLKEALLQAEYWTLHHFKGTLVKGLLFKYEIEPRSLHDCRLCRINHGEEINNSLWYIFWRKLGDLWSKKQCVVAKSSAEAKFRLMAHGIFKLLWLKNILNDLKVKRVYPMSLFWDNKSPINKAHNSKQYKQTKPVEVDRHFIKVGKWSNLQPYISTRRQLADILTKRLVNSAFQGITSKLGMDNLHSPAWGEVLKNIESFNLGNNCTTVIKSNFLYIRSVANL